MIFVVVGTQKFQLNRLLKQVDALIENEIIKEEVFAQIGHSDYCPKHYKAVDFLPKNQFDSIVDKCDLLITHGGVGTIISGLNRNKKIIVYPRLAKYKEHIDDHQLEIATAFSEMGYVLLCKEIDDLGELITASCIYTFKKYCSQRERVVGSIREYLNSI